MSGIKQVTINNSKGHIDIASASNMNQDTHMTPEWLKTMLKDCDYEGDDIWYCKVLDRKTRTAVWSTCRLFGTCVDGVAAQACEIFERYLAIKLREIIMSSSPCDYSTAWENYKCSFERNVPLVIASCVQISCKMTCARTPLTVKKVREVLSKKGVHYIAEEVVKTEAAVFRAIGYRVSLWTSVEMAQLLAHEVGLVGDKLMRVVAGTVTLAEYNRAELEHRVRWAANSGYFAEKARVHTLHLAAGAVVAAARMSVLPGNYVTPLAEMTRAPPLMLTCLCNILLGIVLDPDSSSSSSQS